MNAPKAQYEISYNGTNITGSILPYVLNFTYSDRTGYECDELELTLEDSQQLWQFEWYPTKGDTISAKIFYLGNVLNCGTFTIDEIVSSGSRDSGDSLSIKALAAGITNNIRTKNSYAHENKTLREIANTIAAKHSLTVQGQIQNIRLDRETQYREEDLKFLSRIASEFGYSFSIRDKALVFTNIFELESKKAALTIFRNEVLSYSITDKTSKTYKAIRTKYHNSQKSEVIKHEHNEAAEVYQGVKSDTLEYRIRAENKQQAELKSKVALYRLNSLQQSGNVSVPGNTLAVAGVNAELVNFGMFSGNYYIKGSTHAVDPSGGYITDLDVKRTGIVEKKKRKHYKETTE